MKKKVPVKWGKKKYFPYKTRPTTTGAKAEYLE